MAPSFLTSSNYYVPRKRGPYEVYLKSGTRYESYEYQDSTSTATFWSNQDKYDTSYTVSLVYPSREIEVNVKKLLKRMADSLCKEGWICHFPYYSEPKIMPLSLRGVRLEGRGWGNRK